MVLEFKVLSLNCWGLAYVSKDRDQRMQAIGDYFSTCNFDVICLQEVWTERDYNLLKEKASSKLPYSHYFHSGVTGSGVCILSKHPIEEVFFHQWSLNGYIHKITHGDWFGGKGVGLCRLKVNNLKVNVYSAHLHAEYDRTCDEYLTHRALQAFDTAQFIKMTSDGADLVVMAGDLNTEPGDLAYRLMLGVPGLIDAFCEADEDVQQKNFATNEGPLNSYTPPLLVKQNFPGKRIDYIMFHPGKNCKVTLNKYWLPLPDRVPDCTFSYSDHEAIASVLLVEPNSLPTKHNINEMGKSALQESVDLCKAALQDLHSTQNVYRCATFALFLLLITCFRITLPFGLTIFLHISKVALSGLMFFTGLMATLWNKIEKNGVLSSKLAMEVALKQLNSDNEK